MCLQSRHWGSTQAAFPYFGHLQVRVSPGNQSTSPGVCACVQAINSPIYAISYHYNVCPQSGCSDINRYNEFTCAYVQVTERSVQGANLAYDPTHYCLSLSVFVEHLLKSRQCLQDGAEHELQYRQCRLMQSAGTCRRVHSSQWHVCSGGVQNPQVLFTATTETQDSCPTNGFIQPVQTLDTRISPLKWQGLFCFPHQGHHL